MAKTLKQVALKLAKYTAGEILAVSENGVLVKGKYGKLVSAPGPAVTSMWQDRAQETLRTHRLMYSRFGFALNQQHRA